ncbi:MAG: hypothetical protein K2O13_10835 [Lachnospiraceae bacterium]|nr:hypothetical protein [Lachnospiraceae bacterium]
MQNRKNKSRGRIHRERHRGKLIDALFIKDEDDFEEEDTLEFLSLDDDRTKPRQRKQEDNSYDEDAYGEDEELYDEDAYGDDEELYDEDAYDEGEELYGEDAYSEEEELYDEDAYGEEEELYDEDVEELYEFGEYEFDEYEDDEYDDEYEYDQYGEEGIIVRLRDFLAHMNGLDVAVAMLGIVVLAGVFLAGGLYANAKSVERQVDAFASVGEEMEGISVIGESGLIAVSESARL